MEETGGNEAIIEEFKTFLGNKGFPCVAARTALAMDHIKNMVAGNMCCPANDRAILQFLYDFIDGYRSATASFYSAAVLFKGPEFHSEELFDKFLWQRLQALADMDATHHGYDKRVNADPHSPDFSFSLKGEACFIIGLHPASSRPSRRFSYPAIVFNPHAQFEQLRKTSGYGKLKSVIRKRDISFSGSINPMLKDFGESSEVLQYSGRKYDENWECPLKINHE